MAVPCGAQTFYDNDNRKGFISGELYFGPAEQDKAISEFGVYSYQIYVTDDCGTPVSAVIAEVFPKTAAVGTANAWPINCCKTDSYRVEVPSTSLPAGAVNLLVVVQTPSGPAPDGMIIPFEDMGPGSVKAGLIAAVGGSRRPRHGAVFVSFLVASWYIC